MTELTRIPESSRGEIQDDIDFILHWASKVDEEELRQLIEIHTSKVYATGERDVLREIADKLKQVAR